MTVGQRHLDRAGGPFIYQIFQRRDNLMGIQSGQILVPEIIEFKGILIGRFEVTRAQYGQFETGYNYPRGTGNHPATNIPFEKAAAYCDWLSGQTGRNFRLPIGKLLNTTCLVL